jgi:hypothetical protein
VQREGDPLEVGQLHVDGRPRTLAAAGARRRDAVLRERAWRRCCPAARPPRPASSRPACRQPPTGSRSARHSLRQWRAPRDRNGGGGWLGGAKTSRTAPRWPGPAPGERWLTGCGSARGHGEHDHDARRVAQAFSAPS